MAGKSVTGITLAGSDQRLFYRVRDAYDLEVALGGESIEEALAKRGYRRLVAFLWAGLRHERDRLTQQDVIKVLDKSNLNYSDLWNKVATALSDSGLMSRPGDAEDTGADPTSGRGDGTIPA